MRQFRFVALGQTDRDGAVKASWARRFPVLDLECLLFGKAIIILLVYFQVNCLQL